MKKIRLTFILLASAMLAFSCNQEKEIEEKVTPSPADSKNDIVFVMKDVGVKSGIDAAETTVSGAVIPLFKDDAGNSFSLTEEITELGNPGSMSIMTKGVPVYTENAGTLYGKFAAKAYDPNGTEAADAGGNYVYNSGDGKWRRDAKVTKYPWDGRDYLYFFMNMPSEVSGLSDFTPNKENGSMTFSYTSPTGNDAAKTQQDILFTSRELTANDYNTEHESIGGGRLLFYHALSGVKFRLSNAATDGIKVTKLTFKGLKKSGSCTVTPSYGADAANDTKSKNQVSWTLGTETGEFTQEFTDIVDLNQATGFADSFYDSENATTKLNEQNINAADASLTFWFIPQTLTDAVTLEITYTVNGGNPYTYKVPFGSTLKKTDANGNITSEFATWAAGELRTYTFGINDVNVEISDEVVNNTTKKNITITNTGNTTAFMRVALVGQWVNSKGLPVFGFTDYTDPDLIKEVDSWYNDQFGGGNGHFGEFDGLAGYTKNGKTGTGNDGWVKGDDGYYYYTSPVEAGKKTGETTDTPDGVPPFNSYTVKSTPDITINGVKQEISFVLEIAVQAISAKKLDGTLYTYQEAWANANNQ